MRQRDLEIALEKVPAHPAPKPELEQYRTPPKIAADVLFRAYALGDVAGRRVADLGCGTGMLAIGAAVLGAEDVVGVDVDAAALAAARTAAQELGATIRLVESDVSGFAEPADTVLMNPPFGAQTRNADRPFLAAALACAPVAYSFHLSRTAGFVRAFVEERGARVTHAWDYPFPIPWQFKFHEKAVERVEVTVVRFERVSGPAPL